jgi:hypothetical protein
MFDLWNHPQLWHAINVHFPVVLAVLGVPLVCVLAIVGANNRWLRWSAAAFYVVVALSAAVAMKTGEGARDQLPPTLPRAAWDQVEFHEELAEKVWMLAAGTALVLLLTNLPQPAVRRTFATLAVVASVVTVGWVGVTAHSGGVAVYDHSLGTVAMKQQYGDGKTAVAAAAPAAPAPAAPALAAPAPAATQPAVVAAATPAPAKPVSFANDIKPILSKRCAECHSGGEIKSGFDVSTIAAMAKGGKKGGAGIVAGKPDDSALVQYLEGKKQPRMP